jgi:hypothetical protein
MQYTSDCSVVGGMHFNRRASDSDLSREVATPDSVVDGRYSGASPRKVKRIIASRHWRGCHEASCLQGR